MNYEDEIVEINGQEIAIKDIPNQNLRAFFGVGHFYTNERQCYEVPGIEWQFDPYTCPTHRFPFKWFFNGEKLLCTGCGMDGT